VNQGPVVTGELYEGRTLIGHYRVVRSLQGCVLEFNLREGPQAGKWMPFLAFIGLNGGVSFALVGPKLKEGVYDINGNTALKD
jgi:hypothetical protein